MIEDKLTEQEAVPPNTLEGLTDTSPQEPEPLTIKSLNERADQFMNVVLEAIEVYNLPIASTLGVLRLVEMNLTINMTEPLIMDVIAAKDEVLQGLRAVKGQG